VTKLPAEGEEGVDPAGGFNTAGELLMTAGKAKSPKMENKRTKKVGLLKNMNKLFIRHSGAGSAAKKVREDSTSPSQFAGR